MHCFMELLKRQDAYNGWYILLCCCSEAEVDFVNKCFLQLNDLAVEEVVWVDDVNGLREATSFLEGCKFVGLDCEWKPNYMNGSKPNKVKNKLLLESLPIYVVNMYIIACLVFQVSIMQIGSDSKIFILDLIKLYDDASEILDTCLSQILQSYSILKLGISSFYKTFACLIKKILSD